MGVLFQFLWWEGSVAAVWDGLSRQGCVPLLCAEHTLI